MTAVPLPQSPTPTYPEELKSAGVQGVVIARFVVDTLGHVEPESIQVARSPHERFAAAVRTGLLRMRFSPAHAGGHKVRQVVAQRFVFKPRD